MATTKGSPSDSALQTRIINHMNADHVSSLALYLEHYNNLPPSFARNPQLVEVTLDHLIIKSTYGRSYIPLEPPMTSYAQARERMVTMHQESLTGLDLSDITVKEYVPPQLNWQLIVWVLTCMSYISFSPYGSPYLKSESSLIYRFWSLGGLWHGLPRFASGVAIYVFIFMIVIHVFEAGLLAKTRLRKHGVPFGSWLWVTWMTSSFIEGAPAFIRFDAKVKELEVEKSNKKH